jgi:hypothetical protein
LTRFFEDSQDGSKAFFISFNVSKSLCVVGVRRFCGAFDLPLIHFSSTPPALKADQPEHP